jgi:hypothetical protein
MAGGTSPGHAAEVPHTAVHDKELVAMGTYPHRAGPQHDEPTDRHEPDAEPVVPRPHPQGGNRGTLPAVLVMLVALAIIAVVVLL